MRRLRHLALGLILVSPVLAPAATGASTACAVEAAGEPHAALVIGTGGQTLTYCVALDAPSVSGLRLIQLAGAQQGLQYRLGFGGQAVCQLAGIGPAGGDCFADYPDFWGYWHGDGGGGWTWAGSGAGSASIGDGDVEGWTWGSGDSGASHPAPPAIAFDDVCQVAEPTPPPDDDGGGGGGGGSGGGGGGGGGGSAGGGGSGGGSGGGVATDPAAGDGGSSGSDGASQAQDGNGGRDTDRGGAGDDAGAVTPSPVGSPTADASEVATVASVSDPGGGGPPVAGVVALTLIAGLGVAGWFTLRRRNAGGR